MLRSDTKITGAGRTDAGVNAIGYIAHFDADAVPDVGQLAYKLNAILPPSIVVHSIEAGPGDFHSRFDATRREYTYFLHRKKDPFVQSFSYLYAYPGLDFGLMDEAAALLLGRHDFRCFEKTGTDSKTSICTVAEAGWHSYTPSICAWRGTEAGNEPVYWYFRIAADRFLRNMVRATVGTLLEVGRGKRSLEDFASLVLPPDIAGADQVQGDRCSAGESVPGNALFLSGIEY